VAVISEERILGKFFRPTREWPSPGAETLLVTKTWAPLGNIPRACYELGQKSHRNADFTVGLVPSRSLFPAFLSRF
jgi:hypothetical protein